MSDVRIHVSLEDNCRRLIGSLRLSCVSKGPVSGVWTPSNLSTEAVYHINFP